MSILLLLYECFYIGVSSEGLKIQILVAIKLSVHIYTLFYMFYMNVLYECFYKCVCLPNTFLRRALRYKFSSNKAFCTYLHIVLYVLYVLYEYSI